MITLEQSSHRGTSCILIRGKLTPPAYAAVQNFPGRRYSGTLRCFYIPYSPEQLSALLSVIRQFEEVVIAEKSDGLNKSIPSVEIPIEYREKLERMRYSEATADNYTIQFRKFLEHIHPKTVHDIEEN